MTKKTIFSSFKLAIASGILAQIVAALSGFLRVPILVSNLGPQQYGLLSATIAVWILFSTFGEAARQASRQKGSSRASPTLIKRLLKAEHIWIAVVGVLLFSLFVVSGAEQVQYQILGCIILISFLYISSSKLIGVYEAKGTFSKVNIFNALASLLSLAAVIIVAKQQNLVLITLALLIPGALIGFFLYASGAKRRKQEFEEILGESSFSWLLAILVVESLFPALGPLIVLNTLGAFQTAELSLMQRIMLIFTIIPISLAPMVSTLHKNPNEKQIFKEFVAFSGIISIFAAGFVWMFSVQIFNLLSHSEISVAREIVFFGLTSGIIGMISSPFIQRCIKKDSLKLRLIAALGSTLVGLLTLVSTLPIFGASAYFLSSALGTSAYLAIVVVPNIQNSIKKGIKNETSNFYKFLARFSTK